MRIPVCRWNPAINSDSGLFLTLALTSGAIAFCCGCGSGKQADPNRAAISGTVTYDGKPLPAGAVTFASAEGTLASTVSLDENGRYSTDRAPLGPNQVTIDTSFIKYGNPSKFVPIPAKYADPLQSGLTAEVKAGEETTANFDLKP